MVFLAKTADLDIENMQAPLGNCDIADNQIVEHFHHGSMGNYECLVRRFNEEDMTIVILTNQKNNNVFEISDAILSLIEEKK